MCYGTWLRFTKGTEKTAAVASAEINEKVVQALFLAIALTLTPKGHKVVDWQEKKTQVGLI